MPWSVIVVNPGNVSYNGGSYCAGHSIVSSAVPQSSADFGSGSDEESDDAKTQARFAREAERAPKRSVRNAEILDNKIDRMMEELEQRRPEVAAVRAAVRVLLFYQ